MFSSIAYAQEGAQAGGAAAGIMSFLPFILIIAVFYVLVIRPQQKKQKELANVLKSLKSGDKIITTSGIFGTIDSVADNNTYYVTIANGVKIHIVQSGIAGKIDQQAPTVESK